MHIIQNIVPVLRRFCQNFIESLIQVLMNGFNSEDEEVRDFTSTAIHSLLCNNQKVTT